MGMGKNWINKEIGNSINLDGTISSRSHLSKACGEMIYASDIKLPGMLVGKVLRSPFPHCRIKSIDIGNAKKIPGVHAVITAKDIPGEKLIGKTVNDQPILALDIARTVLDAIALVAAESNEIAELAVNSIELDLEPLPAVFDPYEALLPTSPKLYPEGNLLNKFKIVHGNVENAIRETDVIVKDTYRFPWIEHAYLETESVVSAPSLEDTITVWIGCHNIYGERSCLARAFNWPEERFRVILVPPGGSFGGKDDNLIAIWAALLAYYSNKPVKLSFSRQESIRGHSKRHSQIINHELGARDDGTLMYAKVKIFSDTGAYAHWGESIFKFACLQSTGPYKIPNAIVTSELAYTNNIVAGAMRCWGTPGVEFAVETQMNKLACKLGLHPLKIRWINALEDGDSTITGRAIPQFCNFKSTIKAAAEKIKLRL
jgi:CO/xanthine dehydrogenase Mo-binding subunit